MAKSRTLSEIVKEGIAVIPLTEQQQTEYDAATTCFACNQPFTDKNRKVRQHCHLAATLCLLPAITAICS